MNIVQSEARDFPSILLVKSACCRLDAFCLLLNLMKTWKTAKIPFYFTWISLILIQEYMQYEEYVQFGLISMAKVHMGHMCVWVLKCKVHVFL